MKKFPTLREQREISEEKPSRTLLDGKPSKVNIILSLRVKQKIWKKQEREKLRSSKIFTTIKSIAINTKLKSWRDILRKKIELSTGLNLNMKILLIDSNRSFLKEQPKKILISRFLAGFLTLLQRKMSSTSF
jgi:hypothetical protein